MNIYHQLSKNATMRRQNSWFVRKRGAEGIFVSKSKLKMAFWRLISKVSILPIFENSGSLTIFVGMLKTVGGSTP